MTEALACPFCDFVDEDAYFLMQHVELTHPEDGESPFIATPQDEGETRSSPAAQQGSYRPEVASQNQPAERLDHLALVQESEKYITCPHRCGEMVAAADLQSHNDLHIAERMAHDEGNRDESEKPASGYVSDHEVQFSTSPSPEKSVKAHYRPLKSPRARTPTARKSLVKELLFGRSAHRLSAKTSSSSIRRLGRAELGPYAHEKQMPSWLRRMLEEDAKVSTYNRIALDGSIARVEAANNETVDLVPVLARLSGQDDTVRHAFYCRPEIRHVAKLPREGGFCGYRNIQMIISYIRGARAPGHQHFVTPPSILHLQDMIEHAWEKGFNRSGKIETGGIRLTRKYIGTPEAQALFHSLSIPCQAHSFGRNGDLAAYESLLLSVGEYFSQDLDNSHLEQKLHMTNQPPIYFQHQGHSLTIVGLEVRTSGSINLIVFDPMFHPSPAIQKLVGSSSFHSPRPDKLLRAHRRGPTYLSKYREYELLTVAEK